MKDINPTDDIRASIFELEDFVENWPSTRLALSVEVGKKTRRLLLTILEGLEISFEQKHHKTMSVSVWMRDFGIDDEDIFTASQVSELLESFSWDLLTEQNHKIALIKQQLQGKEA